MFKKLFFKFYQPVRFNLNVSATNIQPSIYGSIRCYATRKRFYKKTNVLYNDGKYEITLDQRKLKTPKGNLFYVESEPLALAVAAEWDAQKSNIIPGKMHLTGLCSTVIDNPNKLTKEDVVNKLIKYLDTDTILYTSNEEDELYELQVNEWLPIIDWFCKRFNVQIQPSRDISGPKISPQDKEILLKYLLSYNFWAVHGFSFAIEALKSVILGISCAERHISVEKAVLLSRLEEEFQEWFGTDKIHQIYNSDYISDLGRALPSYFLDLTGPHTPRDGGKRWGRIEWSHELNQQDIQARVAAGVLFIYANSSSTIVRNKDRSS